MQELLDKHDIRLSDAERTIILLKSLSGGGMGGGGKGYGGLVNGGDESANGFGGQNKDGDDGEDGGDGDDGEPTVNKNIY